MKLKIWQIDDDPACRVNTCPMPDGLQWMLLQKSCCKFGGIYHCQVGENDHATHLCMDPVICPAGKFMNLPLTRLTMRVLGFSCQMCQIDTFQPQATASYHFTRPSCHKQMRSCHELNALMLRAQTHTSDSLCKCNYVQGFRPVPLPDHECLVFESISECKCVHDPCPPGKIKTPDFQCLGPGAGNLATFVAADIMKELAITEKALSDYMALAKTIRDESLRIIDLKSLIDIFTTKNPVCRAVMNYNTDCQNGDGVNRPIIDEHYPDIEGVIPLLTALNHLALVIVPITFIFITVTVCVVRKKRKGNLESIFVQMNFPSKKSCDNTHTGLKNILTFLARQYGHLTLVHNQKSRQIVVVVSPGLAKHEFRLSQFVRDLLSPESIKRITAASSTGADNGVKIVAFHKPPETIGKAEPCRAEQRHAVWEGPRRVEHCRTNQSSTQHKNLKTPKCTWKCSFRVPVSLRSYLTNNTGEVVLTLPDSVDNTALLRELKSSEGQIQSIFKRHHLEFSKVQRGSIIFRFHMPHDSKTLDKMAADRRYAEFAKDLLSHSAILRLCAGQQVMFEFVCKAKLDKVAVILAENLYVQIGARNVVKICNGATPHDHSETENEDDGHLDIVEANGGEVSPADVLNMTFLRLSPRPLDNADPVADHREVELPLNRTGIQVLISSPDITLINTLWSHWCNVLALIQRYHPGCKLERQASNLVWVLPVLDDRKSPDVCRFVDDVLSIENVRLVFKNNSLTIKAVYPSDTEVRIPLRLQVRRLFWSSHISVREKLCVVGIRIQSRWCTPAALLILTLLLVFFYN